MICCWKVTESTFLQKTRIVLPFKAVYPVFPLYCRSAPNNTKLLNELRRKLATWPSADFVAYCPIINTKLSQLGSVSSKFLNVYPCLINR